MFPLAGNKFLDNNHIRYFFSRLFIVSNLNNLMMTSFRREKLRLKSLNFWVYMRVLCGDFLIIIIVLAMEVLGKDILSGSYKICKLI